MVTKKSVGRSAKADSANKSSRRKSVKKTSKKFSRKPTKDEFFYRGKGDLNCSGGGLYGLGFIGAAVYYISTATGFWVGVLGVLKAMVWPAFLIYEVLKYLGA